jgi:hypothetical protein
MPEGPTDRLNPAGRRASLIASALSHIERAGRAVGRASHDPLEAGEGRQGEGDALHRGLGRDELLLRGGRGLWLNGSRGDGGARQARC